MAKKRVNELAKRYDLPSQEIVNRLVKAGIQVKAAASAVDEDMAVAAIEGKPLPSNGNGAKAPEPEAPKKPSTPVNPSARRAQEQKERERQQREGTSQRGGNQRNQRNRPSRPTRSCGAAGPAGPGGVRRVVIDSQASRRSSG
ncbi:MAG: translation initiation factor IF-2 N-terminal domain-containing protein, partial [Solirubrobacteraceae bacterium]